MPITIRQGALKYRDGDGTFQSMDAMKGDPGFSPTATVTKEGSTAVITITDVNGTTTASVSDTEAYTDAEAWSVGKRAGEDVEEGDPAYRNNAKWYAQQAEALIQAAAQGGSSASGGTMSNIADTYSAFSTYEIGEYCINLGELYRCEVPIDEPEPWNDEHWTKVTVGEELTYLMNILRAMIGQEP